jgi:hypothetical protein
MAIIYRTSGSWGAGKGSNLTAAEVDGNFSDSDTRVVTLEGAGLNQESSQGRIVREGWN